MVPTDIFKHIMTYLSVPVIMGLFFSFSIDKEIFTHHKELTFLQDTTQTEQKNQIKITQQGSGNTATVRQSGGTDGETRASIKMAGSGNTTEISFNGLRGGLEVDLAGENNMMLIRPTSILDNFTIQFREKNSETEDADESENDFLLIFRNLDDTLKIHQQSADSLIHIDKN